MHKKIANLKEYLLKLNEQGICLAFSGGVDSTLLLYLCKDLDIVACTFKSVFQTEEEIKLTKEICTKYNVKQEIVEYYPLENSIIQLNPKDRCYHCKKLMFKKLCAITGRNIIDGTNFDDLSTFRPGLRALKELGIISPLAEFKISKEEIREYAKELGISVYNKPSTPCLATRFPYNTLLIEDKLKIVEEGENFLKSQGFAEVRLRLHDDIARIELPKSDFDKIVNNEKIIPKFKELGIRYITLDLEGLRRGSMD